MRHWTFDVYRGRFAFGRAAVRQSFVEQLTLFTRASRTLIGNSPTLIGEFCGETLNPSIEHDSFWVSGHDAPEGDALLQALHASLARELSTTLRREGPQRAIQVALLARKHVILTGLKQIIASIAGTVSLQTTVASVRADPVLVATRQNEVDLLICDPEDLDEALAISQQHGIPLLVYASLNDAGEVLSRGQSVIVEPTTDDQWAAVIQITLRGERYCPQRVSGLYRQLNLEPSRADIQAWAQELPEEWLNELPDA